MHWLGLIFASKSWEPKNTDKKFGAHFKDFSALLGRKVIDSLAEKSWKVYKTRNRTLPAVPFSSIFCPFFCQVCLFSAIFVWFLPYLPVFLPFLPVFKSSFSIFCPMLRLAGQFDTKERFISLAEQNWMNLAPLREYLFGKTGLSDWKKDIVGSP